MACWGLQISGRQLVEVVGREDCKGGWHLGRAVKDREVFGRWEGTAWGRGRGPTGTKVGCGEARVARWEHVAEGGRVFRTERGRIARTRRGGPWPWWLHPVLPGGHYQCLALLPGRPGCWQSLSSVTSFLFVWVLLQESWALAWPGRQETAGRRPKDGWSVGTALLCSWHLLPGGAQSLGRGPAQP